MFGHSMLQSCRVVNGDDTTSRSIAEFGRKGEEDVERCCRDTLFRPEG